MGAEAPCLTLVVPMQVQQPGALGGRGSCAVRAVCAAAQVLQLHAVPLLLRRAQAGCVAVAQAILQETKRG